MTASRKPVQSGDTRVCQVPAHQAKRRTCRARATQGGVRPGSPRYSRMMREDAVRVQRARPDDEREVSRFQGAFDYEVIPAETRRFLSDERHLLLLGYVQDQPAGFVSAIEVFHPDKRSELFLNEIAVLEESRRRGVARALIDELKRAGRERGCVNMWVLTDEDNVAAMGLYRAAGGRWDGDPQVMFEFDLTDE
jgi:ribosomal protein S18 acetylase RimI-like enzyme